MKLYKFLIVNKSNPLIYSYSNGYANGYVAIPKEHPYYGEDYMDIEEDIDVHGGLTLSEDLTGFKPSLLEWLGDIPENFEDYWVFGFDTKHYGDSLERCSREYVISEINSLEQQLLRL